TASFSTDDGELDEQLHGAISAPDGAPPADLFAAWTPLASVAGSSRPNFDASAWDTVDLVVDGQRSGTGAWTGSATWEGFDAQATEPTGSDVTPSTSTSVGDYSVR